ncbi:MAG: hypothetical protein WCG75_03400 [Armatimonadota bacterium]
MNRDKKQLVVIGVLVVLILCVGAFQVMRKPDAAPAPTGPKVVKPGAEGEKDAKPIRKYPLDPLPVKDPFETASFVSGSVAQPPTKPKDLVVPHPLPDPDKKALSGALNGEGTIPNPFEKGPTPLVPPKPVFGYTLIGIVNGAHPMAVFDDGKGNQQLVEVGQGIGPSATITHISRETVRVKFNAETMTFNVGGNPNAK